MAAVKTYDITLIKGRDFLWTLYWKVGKSPKTAVPKPGIGNWVFYFGFKDDYGDVTYLLLGTSTTGEIVVGSDGSIQSHFTATQTEGLPVGKAKFEIMGIDTANGNFKKTLVRGIATIEPKVV